jgi:adenylate kinase
MTRCVVLLGPPGAGKSTQGAMLAARFGLRRIASGELLHQEVRDGTARGRAARRYMAAGELVPDELLVDVVTATIAAVTDAGVVLDGFPRTSAQARLADDVLGGLSWRVDAALEFVVDAATVRARLAGRRTCSTTTGTAACCTSSTPAGRRPRCPPRSWTRSRTSQAGPPAADEP